MEQQLPEGAYLTEISAHYNQHTIPREMRVSSPLPPEIWGRVVVEEGVLNLHLQGGGDKPLRVTPEEPAIIPEDTAFRVSSTGRPVRFYIQYYHEPRLKDPDQLAELLGSGRSRNHRPSA